MLLIIVSVLYFLLILILIIGFDRISLFKNSIISEINSFSIIIPFRNEAENLLELANSLQNIKYSNFEVIFVDDASTDNSVKILKKYLDNNLNWKCTSNIRKSNSPKKDAIDTAIQLAKNNWIITTDADCKVPEKWLQTLNNFIKSNSNIKFIASPVLYTSNGSFFQEFQKIDFLSLIGATIGGFGINKPFLCNGANLCYKKNAFFGVNGFEGNNTIASGDDIFLMEKFQKTFKNSVKFLKSKDAIISTKPAKTILDLYNQRIRWTSKTSKTKNNFGKIIGLLVFIMNFAWIYSFFSLIFNYVYFNILFLLGIKFSMDFILIYKTNRFLGTKLNLYTYFFSGFLYPFFVISVVVLSVFKKYEWKDRVFTK